MLTLAQLSVLAGREPDDNMRSVLAGLDRRGASAGLIRPHRLAHYLAQLAHESGRFRFDREVWGPTSAQARYDTRTDLGNTAARDGDGYRFRGRGPIQVTGAANYRDLTAWAQKADPSAPDFAADPDALLTDPWEGLAPIWFWETRGLNTYADRNDAEMLCRRINGGLNGYSDRLDLYTRSALVLLAYGPDDVRRFQADAGLTVDGVAGPRTRAALHTRLTNAAFAPVEPPATPPESDETAILRDRIARAMAALTA
jgi:putative chitinase